MDDLVFPGNSNEWKNYFRKRFKPYKQHESHLSYKTKLKFAVGTVDVPVDTVNGWEYKHSMDSGKVKTETGYIY